MLEGLVASFIQSQEKDLILWDKNVSLERQLSPFVFQSRKKYRNGAREPWHFLSMVTEYSDERTILLLPPPQWRGCTTARHFPHVTLNAGLGADQRYPPVKAMLLLYKCEGELAPLK